MPPVRKLWSVDLHSLACLERIEEEMRLELREEAFELRLRQAILHPGRVEFARFPCSYIRWNRHVY